MCPPFRLKPNITGPHSNWIQWRLLKFDEKVLTFITVCVTFPNHLLSSAVSWCCLCTWLYMSEWELMNWLIIEVFPTYTKEWAISLKPKDSLTFTSELPRNRILYVLTALSDWVWSVENWFLIKLKSNFYLTIDMQSFRI